MARRLVLLLALCLAACADGPRDDAEAGAVAVRVAGIVLDDEADSPVVILEELNGSGRRLPIWIGLAEAHSIATVLEAQQAPRPNSHDLSSKLIEGLEGRVERVVV